MAGIWFMHENHTFTKLDDKTVEQSIGLIESFLEKEDGFIGWRVNDVRESYQFNKKTLHWRQDVAKVFKLLEIGVAAPDFDTK